MKKHFEKCQNGSILIEIFEFSLFDAITELILGS